MSKKLERLLLQQTRAEIMARLGPIQSMTDYFQVSLAKMDKIREQLFGSSNLVTLGIQWGLITPPRPKRSKKKRSKKKW